MKIALLADIHSNHYALEACFDYIERERISCAAFLGDYISDFPYPEKTLRLIRDFSSNHKTWFVKGNREEYMKQRQDGKTNWKPGSHQGSLLYTYNNISTEDIEWLNGFPAAMTIKEQELPPFSISHSGLENTRQLIYPWDGTADAFMKNQPASLHALAHTHRQFIYYRFGKYLINPGSVGVPVDGSPKTQMAVIESHGDCWIPHCIQLDYDIEKSVSEFYDSGLYDFANVWSRTIIATIRTGTHYNNACLKLVHKLSAAEGLPFDTEELWQKAAEQLGI